VLGVHGDGPAPLLVDAAGGKRSCAVARTASGAAGAPTHRRTTRPVKLNGERREVTALFTDIEVFTATTHRRRPEDLVATLDQYFEALPAS